MLGKSSRFQSRLAARGDRGVILFLSVIMITILLLVLFPYLETVWTEATIAKNRRDTQAVSWGAKAGITMGMRQLLMDTDASYDSPNEVWAEPIQAFDLSNAQSTTGTGSGSSFGSFGQQATSQAEALVDVLIIDEQGKLNLLSLASDEDGVPEWCEEALVYLIKKARGQPDRDEDLDEQDRISPERVAESILDWVNSTGGSSDQGGSFSAADANLGSGDGELGGFGDRDVDKTSPYELLTIAELLLVRGVTRRLLYGPPPTSYDQRRGATQENDDDDRRSSFGNDRDEDPFRSTEPVPLLDFVTCYSSQTTQVNINSAPPVVIAAILVGHGLSLQRAESLASAIAEARENPAEEEEEQNPPTTNPPAEEEEEDEYSFRADDIASLESFNTKLGNEVQVTQEEFELFQGNLAVVSSTFTVVATASAKEGGRGSSSSFGSSNSGGFDGSSTAGDGPERGAIRQTWRAVVERGNGTVTLRMIDREADH